MRQNLMRVVDDEPDEPTQFAPEEKNWSAGGSFTPQALRPTASAKSPANSAAVMYPPEDDDDDVDDEGDELLAMQAEAERVSGAAAVLLNPCADDFMTPAQLERLRILGA